MEQVDEMFNYQWLCRWMLDGLKEASAAQITDEFCFGGGGGSHPGRSRLIVGQEEEVCRWAGMEEGVRRAGGGFLIQISCGLTQQSLESKVTLGSLTVLYANRATHLASGAGLLRGYLCKSD